MEVSLILPLINNRMLRIQNTFLRMNTENFTTVLIDTFKCVIVASNNTQKLVLSVDRLTLRKVLSEGNHIYEYRYKEEDMETSLIIKIGGSIEEVSRVKEQLGSVGVRFSLDKLKDSVRDSFKDYEFNMSPSNDSDVVKMDNNSYKRFGTVTSDEQELFSDRKMSSDFKDTSESISHKKSSFGSLFNIFKRKKEAYSRSSGLLMLNSYSQRSGVLQSTLPIILNLDEGIIDRISKYFTISPPQHHIYNLKVSNNIKEALEIHIHFANPPVHLNFYGPRSHAVFYTEARGYQVLREDDFLHKLSNLHKSLSSAFTVNEPFNNSKVSVDTCISALVTTNKRIAHKIAVKEYNTKTIGCAFRNFLDRKPNSRYTEVSCFEFRPKIRKLINFYLELNFDFNTHIEFIAAFYQAYLEAFKKLVTLIVTYFSYKNKQVRVNSFYVFLLRVFAFETEELINDFKKVFLELLSASNYCSVDKSKDLVFKQKAFYDWFARYNNVNQEFCTDIRYDMRDNRLKELILEVAADKCKDLSFLKTELVYEIKQLRKIDK